MWNKRKTKIVVKKQKSRQQFEKWIQKWTEIIKVNITSRISWIFFNYEFLMKKGEN